MTRRLKIFNNCILKEMDVLFLSTVDIIDQNLEFSETYSKTKTLWIRLSPRVRYLHSVEIV